MAPTGLRHWILHNDRLADEYEQILDLSPAYDPVRDIDPHLTLSAPLLTGPDSLIQSVRGIVGRNSKATYRAPRGAYVLEADEWESRHEYSADHSPLGYLSEPAFSNKSLNKNLDPPESDPALLLIGDPATTLTRVADPEEMRKAGKYPSLSKTAQVWLLDNASGASDGGVQISGASGNTNIHSCSVLWRGAGQGLIGTSGVLSPPIDLPQSYERYEFAVTPLSSGATMQILCTPGSRLFFILNQFEESPKATSFIVGQGGAPTSRAVDSLEWANNGQHKVIDQAEGMLVCVIRNLVTPIDAAPPTGNNSNYAAGINDLLTGDYLLRMEVAAPISRLYSRAFNASAGLLYINVQITDDAPGKDYVYALRWNRALTQFEVAVKDSGVWDRDQNNNYDRFSQSEINSLGVIATAHGFQTRLYNVWDVDRGFDWIDDLYQGIAE